MVSQLPLSYLRRRKPPPKPCRIPTCVYNGGIQDKSEDLTGLVRQWRGGDLAARDPLIPLVHEELHCIAEQFMAGERVDHTLQPTALVDEVYLRLLNVQKVSWVDRHHFFAMSARVMRRVLVDFARLRRARKRGGGDVAITLDADAVIANEPAADVLAG